MIAAIYNHLLADATLMGLLTGGLYLADQVQSISRQNTPAAYDANQEILPCALLKEETITPWGPHPDGARRYVTVWLYQRYGYATTKAARNRIYTLLHRQRLALDGFWQINHATDLPNLDAPGMDAALEMSRYVVHEERA